MSTVSILGLGNWGTALANSLALKGQAVLGWCLEPEIAEGINSAHRNPQYQSNVELCPSLRATTDLDQALNSEVIVMVFPSQYLSAMVPKLKTDPKAIIVSAIKGLERDSLLTPLGYAAQHLPQSNPLAVISGPSFAKDVIANYPAGIVAASEDEQVAERVAEVFSGNRLRVYHSTDSIGVELGGVLKNVIALAAGVSDGLELGDSARAGLITRGLAEITRLAATLGANERTLSGLSGLGDLIMTASCDTSRNRTVGLRLGRGESLQHIIETLGSVAEGVKTAPLVQRLADQHGVDMPITEQVNRLLSTDASPLEVMETLLSRPRTAEFRC